MNVYIFIIFVFCSISFSFLEIYLKRSILLFDLLLVLFWLAIVGFRSIENTPDTSTYYEEFIYSNFSFDSLSTLFDSFYNFEYGYAFVNNICFYLFRNIYVYFIFIALLNLLIIYYFEKKYLRINFLNKLNSIVELDNNKSLDQKFLFAPFFCIYVSYFGFMYSGIVLRQGFASSFFFIAFYFFNIKKYKRATLFGFVALFFHNFALSIIGLLSVYFLRLFKNKKSYFIIVSFFFFLYLFKVYNFISSFLAQYISEKLSNGFLSISPEKVQTYLGGNSGSGSEYSLSLIFNFFLTFISIYFIDLQNDFQQRLLQINILAIILLSLTSGLLAVSRLTDFYSFFNIILYYIILLNLKRNIFKFTFIFLLGSIWSYQFYRMIISA